MSQQSVLSAGAAGRSACAAFDQSSFIAAFAVSISGELLAVSTRFAASLGAASSSALVGRKLADFFLEHRDWSGLRRACLEGPHRNVVLRLRGANNGQVVLKGDLEPIEFASGSDSQSAYMFGVFTDVTDEHKLHQAVQRAARMEALGSLTSGIAHDFNNLLTVLVGNLYLVAEEIRDRPDVFDKLKSARDAAKRGSDLIRQLLNFARREAADTDVLDPADVIERLAPLVGRALGSRIVLDTRLASGAGSVRCNASQLESVIVNLCVNARDGINAKDEAGGRGHVLISVEPAELSGAEAAQRELPPGGYFKIAVADDGSGIARTVLNRVFEPFFSTKGEHGGTGLGLSMVRWFAKQAGGVAFVKSSVGKGTIVCLLLPRGEVTNGEATAKTMPLSQLPTGDEAILVLSREDSLCSTIRQILETLGYRVHIGADPEATLNTLRTADIDLVLIDAALQSAGTREAWLRRAHACRPQVKFVVATDEVIAAAGMEAAASQSGSIQLAKPFSLAELAGAVRQALASEPAAP